MCALPLHHRRLLYPTLTTAQLSDPTIWIPTEHRLRCPRIWWGSYKGTQYVLPCGRTKRHSNTWQHIQSDTQRQPSTTWTCHNCIMAWGNHHKGTRMSTLRSPYHTIQYITGHPNTGTETTSILNTTKYTRKVTALQPRQYEQFRDEPHKTTRIDITDDQDLVDLLYQPPNVQELHEWLLRMVTNSRAAAATTSTGTD